MKEKTSLFKQGLKDGFPIGMGYLPLAFTLGVNATTGGFNFLVTNVMSLFSFTGVGMITGMDLMIARSTYLSFFIALLVINLRNIVLSLSLSQRLEPNISAWKRLIISMGNTDEIFALTIRREGIIPSDYFLGVMTLPYAAWGVGTIVGSLATQLVPKDICTAMGMALYAMLIAAVVPAMKKSKPILFVAILSGTISFVMQGIKPIDTVLKQIWGKSATSLVLVVGSLLSAIIAALIWPLKESKGENNE